MAEIAIPVEPVDELRLICDGIPFAFVQVGHRVTMLRLKTGQRAVLVETLRELANLAAGALVLGQFVGQQPLSLWVVLGGVALWLVLVGSTVVLTGED